MGFINLKLEYFPTPFLRLKACLYDDCDSSLPLEFNVFHAPSTDLKEVFDPPLISLSFIAQSFASTPMDTSVSDLNLLASPLSLA